MPVDLDSPRPPKEPVVDKAGEARQRYWQRKLGRLRLGVEPLRDQLFLVTWQEKEGDTVVHIEDYKNNTIITNITDPGSNPTHPTFSRFHGTMKQIA